MYEADTVLDFSSGWGDRLIGFLASKASTYWGFDPNECVQANYLNMIDFFEPYLSSKKTVKLFCNPLVLSF